MSSSQVRLVAARDGKKRVITNLIQLYLYDQDLWVKALTLRSPVVQEIGFEGKKWRLNQFAAQRDLLR